MIFIDHLYPRSRPLKLTIIGRRHDVTEPDDVIISGQFLRTIATNRLERLTYRNSLGEEKSLLSAIFTTPNPRPEPFFTLSEIIEFMKLDDDTNYWLGFASEDDRRLCLRATDYRDISQMSVLAGNLGDLHIVAEDGPDEIFHVCNVSILRDLTYHTKDLIEIGLPRREFEAGINETRCFGTITVRGMDYIAIMVLNSSRDVVEAWIYHPEGLASMHVMTGQGPSEETPARPTISITKEKNLSMLLDVIDLAAGYMEEVDG